MNISHRFILLIDDDPDDQVIFLDTLNEIHPGLHCVTASSGREGLKMLASHQPVPTLIFLDLNMPLMNGFECLERIKTGTKHSDIPVIIFTTSTSPIDQKRTVELGAKTFLNKTPDADKLKQELLDILTTA